MRNRNRDTSETFTASSLSSLSFLRTRCLHYYDMFVVRVGFEGVVAVE